MRILVLLCVGAAVISGGATAARTGTGLYGRVLISPAYPVCQEGVPCTRPAGHVLLRFSRSGRVVATTRTQTNGTYSVALAGGTYAVSTPAPKSGLPSLTPRKATVPRDRYARVIFKLDVGIR